MNPLTVTNHKVVLEPDKHNSGEDTEHQTDHD